MGIEECSSRLVTFLGLVYPEPTLITNSEFECLSITTLTSPLNIEQKNACAANQKINGRTLELSELSTLRITVMSHDDAGT